VFPLARKFMNLLQQIWRSSLGKKYIMALSGAGMFLFVVGHLLGNLQFFLPPEAINRYGHFLKSTPEILWPARLGLLALVGLHIASAVTLSAQNKAARPQGYAGRTKPLDATLASRTMLFSGLIILAFIVYHLLHFTAVVESVNFAGFDFDELYEPNTGLPDIYAMMVCGFSVWYVSLFYVIAIGLLCLHLGHGLGAMFQSLGLRDHVWGPRIAGFAKLASLLLFAGYISLPVSVLVFHHGKEYADRVKNGVVPGGAAPAAKVLKGGVK
jgi:succinate dehydrogenase / fumarate reductase cytochrome b subunit